MKKIYSASILFFFAIVAIVFYKINSQHSQKENAKNLLAEKMDPNDFFYLQRSWPDKQLDYKAYEAGIYQAQQARNNANKVNGWNASWTTEGPGNIGGRVNAVATHPTNANIVYVGFANGGVWKTINAGNAWVPIFDAQAYLSIGCITIDPVNNNTIYVGTGDVNISGYPLVGNGVYKSVDGGNTWTHMGLALEKIISQIVVDPSNNNIVYAAAMGLPMARDNNRGMYKSINGGQTWTQILFVHDDTGFIDALINPLNPLELFAVSWTSIRNNQERVASGIYSRVWKSTDGGINWNVLSNGLPQGNLSRIGISMYEANPNILYVSVVDSVFNLEGVYKTIDGGNSWNAFPLNGLDMNMMAGFGWYFGKIMVNPTNSNDVFLLGVDLWRTTNGGANWFMTTDPWWMYTQHADKHVLLFDSNNDIYMGTDGGLYRSNDDANSWNDIEDIPTNQFYRVACNPFDPGGYYGGMQDNGTSGGNSAIITAWPRIYGGDGFQSAYDPNNANISYAETQWGNIVYSDDGGNNFYNGTVGIDTADRRSWDMPFVMNANNSSLHHTGTYRVYQNSSAPYGQWWPISPDLTDGNIFGPRFHVVSAIDNAKLNPLYIYAGTSDGNVWNSLDGGTNWNNISNGLPDRYVTSIKSSPNVLNNVYVTHSGYKSNEYIPHVHKSVDNGVNWTDISGDLPQIAVNDILVYPNNDSILFVATDAGVYGTINGGVNWNRIGNNMPLVNVYDIEINPFANTLMAGTFGRSLMSLSLDSLFFAGTVEKRKSEENDIRIFPNPVKDMMTIELGNIDNTQNIELTLYDLSGKMVFQKSEIVVNKNRINVSLSSEIAVGNYLCKTIVGNKQYYKKLVRIK